MILPLFFLLLATKSGVPATTPAAPHAPAQPRPTARRTRARRRAGARARRRARTHLATTLATPPRSSAQHNELGRLLCLAHPRCIRARAHRRRRATSLLSTAHGARSSAASSVSLLLTALELGRLRACAAASLRWKGPGSCEGASDAGAGRAEQGASAAGAGRAEEAGCIGRRSRARRRACPVLGPLPSRPNSSDARHGWGSPRHGGVQASEVPCAAARREGGAGRVLADLEQHDSGAAAPPMGAAAPPMGAGHASEGGAAEEDDRRGTSTHAPARAAL